MGDAGRGAEAELLCRSGGVDVPDKEVNAREWGRELLGERVPGPFVITVERLCEFMIYSGEHVHAMQTDEEK